MRHWSITLCLAMLVGVIASASAPAVAASAQGSIFGTIIDQQNALPVKGAIVELLRDGKAIASGTTDSFGKFSISDVPGGAYDVRVSAKGYAHLSTLSVSIASGESLEVDAALTTAVNTAGVHTIGTVSVSGRALASATAITQTVNVQNVAQTGQLRYVNQLATLPALNVQTSSSPGDDTTVNIRGFGASETGVLLDGRPVGPQGVLAPNTYNFANSPISALDSVDVTYGSGAQGLYGSDTIAGAVNMHLINTSISPQYTFQQQIGGFNTTSTAGGASGTYGKVGYALAAGVAGSEGQFNGSQLFQSARPSNVQPGSVNPPFVCANSNGNDVSQCSQATSTYAVSQNYKLTTELAKLKYAFSGVTALTLSGYSGVVWADSTGNGDNDNLPYATRLAQIQQSTPTCTTPSGAPGYTVTTNPVTSATACYTAQQWASVSSGPDGGGAGRQRSTTMQDYDSRLTTKLGVNNVSLDYYVNNYIFWKDSSISGGLDAVGSKLGTPVYANYYLMHGYLVSDDISTTNNDLGFGWALLNQLQAGQGLAATGSNPVTGENLLAFQPTFDPQTYRVNNWFVRDSHQFGERFYALINAWFKASNVTGKTTFDPRISAQYRPDSNDVVRLTYGHSDGPPAPQLKSTGVLFQPDPGASLTNVNCNLNTLPTGGGNPNLTSEAANDWELGYGHRFEADSNIQVNAFVTSVSDQLFGATQPLLQYGLSNVVFGAGTLNTYLARLITQGCVPPGSPVTATYPFLGISTTYNAANELARGIELNGRGRLTPNLYLDYGWSVESSQQFNIPDSILMNNFTLLNGSQQVGIPLHQANLSVDYHPGAFEVRLDNYYVSANNTLNRPSYIYSNFWINHPLEGGKLLLTLGGTNIFNQAVQNYGYIGAGPPVSANQFAPSAPFTGLGQDIAGIASNEQFGLQPAQLTFTLTARI